MVSLILCALLAQPAAPPPPPVLADGVRQVEAGDFETAVVTLRAVAASLAGDPARSVERARAHLYLGVAHVALDQAAEAHRAFAEALRDDPRLRLTEDRYSPKVIAAFEAARREQQGAPARAASAKGSGSTRKVVVGAIAGAAVATGALVALGGSEAGMRMLSLRFASAFIDCPDGANALPIAYTMLADVANDGDTAAVLAATITAIITASTEAEVGQTSNRPVTVAPTSLPGKRTTTLRLDSTLLCSNGVGGPPRENEWTARLTITTSSGTVSGETFDRLRVNIP